MTIDRSDPTADLPDARLPDTGRRYVLTKADGGVTVVCPSPRFKAVVTGAGVNAWLAARGYEPEPWRDELWWWRRQVKGMVKGGIEEQPAWRIVYGISRGGFSDRLFFAALADYACKPQGTGIELWDAADVPGDRWFRDAWRRAAEGGPIRIDLQAARGVQEAAIARAVDDWNTIERRDPSRWGHNGPAFIELDWRWLRRATAAARSPEELMMVWPADLARPPTTERARIAA